jgi:hypothetical protein
MNIKLFEKAHMYYYSGEVQLLFDKPDKIWFNVDDEDVWFEYTGYLKISCSCEYCGKKGIPRNSLCSRKLACLLYLEHKHIKMKK